MLDCKGWLKEKKPGQDAKQGQLKSQKTQKPVILLKPDRGEQPRMGLKAGKSTREGCEDPGSGCSIFSHEEGGCNGPDILVVKEKPDSGSSRQNLPNGKCQIN